jgi:hypothetical protein
VKTVYDLYHWSHPDACAEVTYGFATREAAAQSAGIAPDAVWQRCPHDDGWLIDPDPVTGRQTKWGVFESQSPQTDAERIQLALAEIANFGQTDGDHHKAYVIDQVVRLLAEDYDAWIAEYRDGEDGPETYSWDTGIAP